jgi:hypothetical protein
LWIFFQLTTYCRPSESYLKLKYVIEPMERKGPLSFTSVIVRPFEEEVPSKNGSFNHGIILDDPTLSWVGQEVALLKRRRLRELRSLGMSQADALEENRPA